jgi:hypothetical protein
MIDAPSSDGDSPLGALVSAEQEDTIKSSRVWQDSRSILCIPGYSKLDESAAIVLAQGLRRRGYGAFAERADALSVSRFFSLDLADTKLVCICYVDPPSNAKLHYAVRRLTKKSKSASVIVLVLGPEADTSAGKKLVGVSAVTSTFAATLDEVEQKAKEASTLPAITTEYPAPSASAAG